MMENILEIKDLKKSYGGFCLDNISFNLERGYIMGFIGPNGAGKSTTIKLIMNLIKRDRGDIKIFGMDNIKEERQIKERIGFVYDENHFYEDLTIDQTKQIIAPFYKSWDEKAYKKYIRDFELPSKLKIQQLSKGMKMKFSLALALSHDAEFIIMDEPTSGLDPVVRRELLDILYSIIQDEKRAVLFSTHNTTDLDKIADYITFINRGKMIFSLTKDDIIEQYGIVKGDTSILNQQLREKIIGLRESSYGFEGLCKNSRELKRDFGNRIIIERPNLEDIMIYTVRGEKQCIA